MQRWGRNFKQRGEWVELVFMAAAALHGYHILKPWGDSFAYDLAVEQRGGLLRVQVKGFSARKGGGYLCRLRHGGAGLQRYHPDHVDLFALYILPTQARYLIPSAIVRLPKPKMHLTVYPDAPPRPGRHTPAHDYEPFREAWGLLAKDRRDLARPWQVTNPAAKRRKNAAPDVSPG